MEQKREETASSSAEKNDDILQDNTIISFSDTEELSIEDGEIDENIPSRLMEAIAPVSESLVCATPDAIPDYQGEDYIILNNNIPMFTEYETAHYSGEHFSELDSLGRCGYAMAMIDSSLMPTEERGSIGMIQPSGWHTIKYPDIISDLYLYNRCHLIGYALTGQNDNELNLITGTRYLNVSIMLIFEREVIYTLEETGFHVLYRVTPFFKGDDLVARGIEMEAVSVEDEGKSLCFHVFCYNIQPGIGIDYSTGDSWEE